MSGVTSLDDLPMVNSGGQAVQMHVTENQGNQVTVQQGVSPSLESIETRNQREAIDLNKVIEERNNDIKSVTQGSGQVNHDAINQMVASVEAASSQGAVSLPVRDVPMQTSSIVQDPSAHPNHVPGSEPSIDKKYMEEISSHNDILEQAKHQKNKMDTMDYLLDELQWPILGGILYFVFRLPYFDRLVGKYIPSLIKGDGNMKLGGYLVSALAFSIVWYGVSKVMKVMTEI